MKCDSIRLIRHAETVAVAKHEFMSDTSNNCAFTEEGKELTRRQAEQLGEYGFDVALFGPIERVINTMKLVGASWSFIRRPFLVNGFTLGIVSAILADAAILSGLYWLHNFEPTIHAVIGFKDIVVVSAAVFLFGIIITFFCTFFSINKYLKMNSRELYYI